METSAVSPLANIKLEHVLVWEEERNECSTAFRWRRSSQNLSSLSTLRTPKDSGTELLWRRLKFDMLTETTVSRASIARAPLVHRDDEKRSERFVHCIILLTTPCANKSAPRSFVSTQTQFQVRAHVNTAPRSKNTMMQTIFSPLSFAATYRADPRSRHSRVLPLIVSFHVGRTP